jgi:NSS family neurotransmitter:Na+ symporter
MFVLAAMGFVIGLKNVWQFPHHLALYGGSAYLLVYALFLLLLGVPLLMSQLMLGRLVRSAPPRTLARLAQRVRAAHAWRWLGLASVLAGFLVLAYYNVVAGWILAYTARAVSGSLSQLTAEGAASIFTTLVQDPEKQLFWHSLFVVLTFLPLAVGLRAGLERAARYGVPAILLLLFLQVGYAAGGGAFALGTEYLLRFDPAQLDDDGIIVALGDAFFSLGLGVGTFMMYGACLPGQGPLLRTALIVVFADIAAGLCAGLAIFPVLFAGGTLSAAGPGLVFQSLIVAYDALPLGELMRALLFVLLALIAWLSALGLAAPAVAWLSESRGLARPRAAAWTGFACWLIGVVGILSLHPWAFSFTLLGVTRTLGLFDVLIVLTSFVLLPLVGIGVAIFAGWVLRPEFTREALAIRSTCLHDVWLWLTRLVAPVCLVLLIFGIRLFL